MEFLQVYHSKFATSEGSQVSGLVLLQLKTEIKGPAPPGRSGEEDIIDEAIELFRANVMFRSFEVESPADRVLIYLTVYISECIRFCKDKKTLSQASKDLFAFSKKSFKIPGDSGFSLGGFMTAPKNRNDGEKLRGYFKQLREECALRILKKIYDESGEPNKHWMQFARRKFMNIDSA